MALAVKFGWWELIVSSEKRLNSQFLGFPHSIPFIFSMKIWISTFHPMLPMLQIIVQIPGFGVSWGIPPESNPYQMNGTTSNRIPFANLKTPDASHAVNPKKLLFPLGKSSSIQNYTVYLYTIICVYIYIHIIYIERVMYMVYYIYIVMYIIYIVIYSYVYYIYIVIYIYVCVQYVFIYIYTIHVCK